jgi:hypothetical protein
VPNCYHATSSCAHETGKDVAQCVRDIGGPGQLRKLATDGRKVHSFVYYETKELAARYLEAITECLEAKDHEVYEAAVLEDFEELGLDVEGYPPDSDASA